MMGFMSSVVLQALADALDSLAQHQDAAMVTVYTSETLV